MTQVIAPRQRILSDEMIQHLLDARKRQKRLDLAAPQSPWLVESINTITTALLVSLSMNPRKAQQNAQSLINNEDCLVQNLLRGDPVGIKEVRLAAIPRSIMFRLGYGEGERQWSKAIPSKWKLL